MSTLAFKANTVYLPEYGPAVCTPDFNLLPAGAPCETNPLVGVPTQNVYAVIDAGFEDKIVMDDYGCNATPILGRSGQPSDAENGCFVRDLISPANWGSDLPAPYIDTTAFDDGELYQPGAGSANPEAIIEGAAYVWYTGFYQYGLESTATHTLRHISSVTSYVDNAISQAIGCESSKPEFCYFQTDQTNIGPSDQLD
jgi:hypothetical protein